MSVLTDNNIIDTHLFIWKGPFFKKEVRFDYPLFITISFCGRGRMCITQEDLIYFDRLERLTTLS